MAVELGVKYRDHITGFRGIATGRVVYLTGPARVLLETLDQCGDEVKHEWFDEERLDEVVQDKEKAAEPQPSANV